MLLSSFMRMPHGSEPQSIRTRSEESEEGGVPPDVMVDASSKAVADQDDENRIAPAGFDVNGEETSVKRLRSGRGTRHQSGRAP